MSVATQFESANLLLQRAIEDLDDFNRRVDAFQEACVWTQGEELNRKTGEKRIYMTLQTAIPGADRVTASEIVNNCRHVLDQAVCAASILLGVTSTDKVYFPFAKAKGLMPAQIKYRCRDIPAELVPFLIAYEPYLGGDDELWALSRIAGPNKHQVMLEVAVDVNAIHLVGGELTGPGTFGHVNFDGAKRELNLGTIKPGGHYKPHLAIPVEVVFGQTDVVGGKPAAAILRTFVGKAQTILSGIEAETRRLLALKP